MEMKMCPHCLMVFLFSLPILGGFARYLYLWYKARRTTCASDHSASHSSGPRKSCEKCSEPSSLLDQMM